jgi:hypothetical protein
MVVLVVVDVLAVGRIGVLLLQCRVGVLLLLRKLLSYVWIVAAMVDLICRQVPEARQTQTVRQTDRQTIVKDRFYGAFPKRPQHPNRNTRRNNHSKIAHTSISHTL